MTLLILSMRKGHRKWLDVFIAPYTWLRCVRIETDSSSRCAATDIGRVFHGPNRDQPFSNLFKSIWPNDTDEDYRPEDEDDTDLGPMMHYEIGVPSLPLVYASVSGELFDVDLIHTIWENDHDVKTLYVATNGNIYAKSNIDESYCCITVMEESVSA